MVEDCRRRRDGVARNDRAWRGGGGGGRSAAEGAAEDDRRGAVEVGIEEEEKQTGHNLIYPKGLRYRVIRPPGAFEGLRHQFGTHSVP